MTDERPPATIPRVLLFVWSIPHYRAALYRRLSHNPDIHFTVCTGQDPSVYGGGTIALADEVQSDDGIRRRTIRSRRLRGPLLRDWEWQPEALGIVWRERPDAVITFGTKSVSNWLLRVVCKMRGVALLDWGQGVKGPQTGLKWVFRKILLDTADAVLVYGTWARDYFVSRGVDARKIFIVRNSLDHDAQVHLRESISPADIAATRREFGADGPDARLIVHVGRLEFRKRLDLLIEALASRPVSKQSRDRKVWDSPWRGADGKTRSIDKSSGSGHQEDNRGFEETAGRIIALIVGDGPEEAGLKELARAKGVAHRIHFLGAVYDEARLARLFCAADLCVAPGAVGLLAMHSLVYGTPVLTCENADYEHGPEVETIVEGQTGGYCRLGDSRDLSAKMHSMLFPDPCKPRISAACRRAIDDLYTPAHQEHVFLEAMHFALRR